MAVGLAQQQAAYCGMMTLKTMMIDDDDECEYDGISEHKWQRKILRII